MKTKVWDYNINGFREVEIIGRVRYVGTSYYSMENGKIYDVLANEEGMLRIKDETEEDYLYVVDELGPNKDGCLVLVDDFYGMIQKAL